MRDMQSKPLIQLLGPAQWHGPVLAQTFPERGFLLLAMIATAPGFRLSRQQAAVQVWPRTDEAKARTNLRQLLVRIDRATGLQAGLIVPVGSDLTIKDGTRIDACVVSDLLQTGQLSDTLRAIDLFAGPLMQGFNALPASDLNPMRDLLCRRVASAAIIALDQMTRFGAAVAGDIARIEARQDHLQSGDAGLGVAIAQAYARIGDYDRARAALRSAEAHPATAQSVALTRRLGAVGSSVPDLGRPMPVQTAVQVPRLALMYPKSHGAPVLADLAGRLVEELAFGLAAYHSFAVLAPYSSFAMADEFGLPRDNSLLRADYAVSSSLDEDTAGVTLRLRLTDLRNRAIVWACTVPMDTAALGQSLRHVMARVVMTIAAELERTLRDDLRLTAKPPALLHFLQGRTLQARCDLPHVRRARSEFARALTLDQGFAPAHARIAETLFVEWILRGGTDPELLAAARMRAARAMELEPSGSTGHWITGAVALYQRRWDVVEEAFTVAQSLSPHDADMLLEFGDALSHLGQHTAAETRFAAALDLNPVPPDRYWWFGASIAFNRLDFVTAAARCDQIADKSVALGLRTASYAQAGQPDLARKWARRLKETLPGMTAADLIGLSPDRDGKDSFNAYVDGLAKAGVK